MEEGGEVRRGHGGGRGEEGDMEEEGEVRRNRVQKKAVQK